jgi:hypothetical protein
MQYCFDCKNFKGLWNVLWLMNKKDCQLNIQRESQKGSFGYSNCENFEQEDKTCSKTCEWCLWKEKNQTCIIHKYPKRIIKCNYYQKPNKKTVTWNVTCSPRGYCEDGLQSCQCFIVGNDPKAIYKLQSKCIQKITEDYYEPDVPTKFTSLTFEEFKKKLENQ